MQRAVEGGDDAERDDDEPPPQKAAAEQRLADADDAVDAEVDHRPGHERRDRARCFRMRTGQPDVERHRAGLGGESDEHEQERDRAERRREGCGVRADVGEGLAAGVGREQHEPDQDRRRAEVGHRRVPLVGVASGFATMAVLDEEQEHRGERHQLPGDHEGRDARSGGNEEQARQEQREHRGRGPTSERVLRVADAVATRRQADDGRRCDEQRAERVEREVDAGEGQDLLAEWNVTG